jgi:hypothetical protein
VFWKEIREWAIASVIPLMFAVLFGIGLADTPHGQLTFALLIGLGIEGLVVGAGQAVRDRRERGDEFMLHRPVSAVRIHVARGAAGFAVLAVSVAAMFGTTLYVVYRAMHDVDAIHRHRVPDELWWRELEGPRTACALLFAAATWALARLGGSVGARLTATLLAPGLPLVLVLVIGRTPGVGVPVAVTAAAFVVASLLSAANATVRRAARRS